MNFNCVLLIIRLAEDLKILSSWPREILLPMQLTFFEEKIVTPSWNEINHFAILNYLYQRDRLQTLLLILSGFPLEIIIKKIFSDEFRGPKVNSFNIRSKIWRQFLNTRFSVLEYQLIKEFRYLCWGFTD